MVDNFIAAVQAALIRVDSVNEWFRKISKIRSSLIFVTICSLGVPHAVRHPPLLLSSVDNFIAAVQAALIRVDSFCSCSFR